MKTLLSKLTGEQALDVLQRLAAGNGAVAETHDLIHGGRSPSVNENG
jgi:hypothetical protein